MTGSREPAAMLAIRVVPRAGREGVAGYDGEVLRIRLNAPPVEGKANEALARFLARELGVPRARVALVSGGRNRNKVVRIEGMTLQAAISALIPPGGPTDGDPRAPRTGSR